jgi:hypothetical protein
MKSLTIGLMALSISLSLPVNAQPSPPAPPSRPSAPPQNNPSSPSSRPSAPSQNPPAVSTQRVGGSECFSKFIDGNQKETKVDCHHVVITGQGTSTVNFHFDSEREDAGLTYVVGPMQRDPKGRTYHMIQGFMARSGERKTPVVRASGICSMDPQLIGNKQVGCIAELTNGSKSTSVLFR